MRPHDRGPTTKAASQNRVRAFIKADLWWLAGFPVRSGRGGVDWLAVPARLGRRAPELVHLEREHLRRATSTSKSLLENFPRALPATVGNTAAWFSGVEALLARLKPAVHDGAVLPSGLFRSGVYPPPVTRKADRIREAHPKLGALLDAMSWRFAPQTARVAAPLEWIAAHAGEFEVWFDHAPVRAPAEESPDLALSLWHLVEVDGEAAVEPLLRLLGDRRLYEVAPWGSDTMLPALRDAIERLDFSRLKTWGPPSELPHVLIAWLQGLLVEDPPTRRRAMKLLGAVHLETQLRDWQVWWEKVQSLLEAACHLTLELRGHRKRAAKKLRPLLNRLREQTPWALEAHSLVRALRDSARPEASARFPWLIRALERLPMSAPEVPTRAAFLSHWNDLAQSAAREKQGRLVDLLREFGVYLRQSILPPAVILRSWYSREPRQGWSECDQVLLERLPREGDFAAFFDALALVQRVHTKGIRASSADSLVDLVALVRDAKRASELYLQVAEHVPRGYVREHVLRVALEFASDAPQEFGRIVCQLDNLLASGQEGHLLATARALRDSGFGVAPIRILLEHQSSNLVRCAVGLELLQQLGIASVSPPPPGEATHPEWIDRCPDSLHAVLEQLASVHAEARQVAARVLRPITHDAASRNTEIELLRARLATAVHPERIRRRLEALESQRESPPPIPENVLRRLRAKLERARATAVLERWTAQIETALFRAWSAIDTQLPPPDWLIAPEVREMLLAITALPPSERQLGLRLVALRAGPRPWDLRDEPANRKFVEHLVKMGIDMRPWLDGMGVREHTGPDGQKVRLGLEEDPLEIFAMGAHFRTCLSPLNCNFFSVIANAADVNKRILYARDADRKVIGRCLLALTDDGKLLAFHPYCHDRRLEFDTLVRDFALALASRMGTAVVPCGRVSTLVARRWYDDGPVDFAGSFACLSHGSKLRGQLARLEAKDFVATLEAALAPLPFDDLTLPLVLRLPEIAARPELIVALVPRIERSRLGAGLRLEAAALLEQAGEFGQAARVFGRQGVEEFLDTVDFDTLTYGTALRLLLRSDPAGVLRVLRRTLQRGVRRFEDDPYPDRLYYAALAHESLLRPRRALHLYTLAASKHWSEPKREECRERAANLAARLGA